MSKVVVSIVSFNCREFLKNCLKDLLAQKTKAEIEIWVLDNNSIDGSVEMVKKDFPKIRLISEDKNLGFAKGQNVILKKSQGDYYLLVNPDTQIPEEAIEKMVRFIEENPECGIAGSKLTGFNGKLQPNGGDLPFGLSLLSWLFNLESIGIKSNFHRVDREYYQDGKDKGWVGGTFMMIKKEALEKIGVLNTDYFMYVEDVEYCYRAGQKGFKVMINPNLAVIHRSGGSSEDPRLFQWQNEFKNLIVFYKKNLGIAWAITLRVLIYLSLILRIIAFGILGKGGVSLTYAKIFIGI